MHSSYCLCYVYKIKTEYNNYAGTIVRNSIICICLYVYFIYYIL